MADLFNVAGKVIAMNAIKGEIISVVLLNDAGQEIDTQVYEGSSFTVDTAGEISNSSVLTFTIGAEAIGETAAQARLSSMSGTMITLDLDANVSLTTAGEAEFAVGALTATL
jgi:hypothetical protein